MGVQRTHLDQFWNSLRARVCPSHNLRELTFVVCQSWEIIEDDTHGLHGQWLVVETAKVLTNRSISNADR